MKITSTPINRIKGRSYRIIKRKLTLLIITTDLACSGIGAVMIVQTKKIKKQKEEVQKLQSMIHKKDFEIFELIERNEALLDQKKQMREAIEELKEIIDDLNAQRYLYDDYYFDDLESFY